MAVVIIVFICFILGSSLFFIAIAEDITKDLSAFNCTLKTMEDRHRERDCVKLIDRFCAIIQVYSEAKQ